MVMVARLVSTVDHARYCLATVIARDRVVTFGYCGCLMTTCTRLTLRCQLFGGLEDRQRRCR